LITVIGSCLDLDMNNMIIKDYMTLTFLNFSFGQL